jgi:regulator of sigma E protease
LFKGLGFDFWLPMPAVIGHVLPNGAAARAGLGPGDRIVAIDGVPMSDWHAMVAYISPRPGAHLTIDYRRGTAQRSTQLEVGSEESHGQRVGRIGVESAPAEKIPDSMLLHRDLGPVDSLGHASTEAWNMTVLQARLFWRMVIGKVSVKNLSGPLSIAEFAGESAHAGAASFLSLLVLLSLSLGFLNLLPIPILDGGQIVFQVVEWLKGSPLSERAQAFGQQLGIVLLIVLMGVALYNDIARQFS